jgi:hypothetical protein
MKPANRMSGIAFLTLLLMLGGSRWTQAKATEVAGAEVETSTAIQGQPSFEQRPARSYQERETRYPEAANFRGGDSIGIYIGGSAGLLVVVLLVLLLLR